MDHPRGSTFWYSVEHRYCTNIRETARERLVNILCFVILTTKFTTSDFVNNRLSQFYCLHITHGHLKQTVAG